MLLPLLILMNPQGIQDTEALFHTDPVACEVTPGHSGFLPHRDPSHLSLPENTSQSAASLDFLLASIVAEGREEGPAGKLGLETEACRGVVSRLVRQFPPNLI